MRNTDFAVIIKRAEEIDLYEVPLSPKRINDNLRIVSTENWLAMVKLMKIQSHIIASLKTPRQLAHTILRYEKHMRSPVIYLLVTFILTPYRSCGTAGKKAEKIHEDK